MELHLIRTIAAVFLGLTGFFMDMQSFIGGLRVLRTGRGTQGLLVWPFLLYALAALLYEGAVATRAEVLCGGLAFHLISTVGLRSFRR